MHLHTIASLLLTIALSPATTPSSGQPKPIFPEPAFNFGKITRGTVIEHVFVLRNEGTAPLRLGTVKMSSALTLITMPASVAAGDTAKLVFKLDSTRLAGLFEGIILVSFADPSLPDAHLSVEGTVVALLEASPPAFFVAVDRGKTQEQSLEIRSHEPGPVRIEKVEFTSDRASVRVDTLEEGRRYRLTLTAKGEGAAGKKTEIIQLRTSSQSMPLFRIAANTFVRERVYTFPEVVDLGALPISVLTKTPELLQKTAQTLMVYRKGTTDFEARVTTDLPMLDLKSVRGPAGDRVQTTVTLKAEMLKVGVIRGSIVIETNDPEFRRLTVPVSGQILDR